MRVFIINLASEVERMNFQLQQAEILGLAVERIAAFDVNSISPSSDNLVWRKWQRPLRDVEKAAVLSHRSVWMKIAAESMPSLVLEDDAILMPGIKAFLTALENLKGVDHLSLETRGRKKIVGSPHEGFSEIRRLWLDRTGAAAYVLWPEGARKLLRRFDSVPALADAVPVETKGLKRWQADPAMATQIDISARYDLKPPLTVKSSISNLNRPKNDGLIFKFRRLARQIIFIFPHLKLLTGSQKKEVILKFSK